MLDAYGAFLRNPDWLDDDFFVEWSRAVVTRLREKKIYLLVDETRLGARMAVMMVGVAFDKRCIPLLWRCYKANSGEDYPPEGQVQMIMDMLSLIQKALPKYMKAVVLADRGIGCSSNLCSQVDKKGLGYLFRLTRKTKMFNEEGEITIFDKAKRGEKWSGEGLVFKKKKIPARIHSIWAEGYVDPLLLVTNDKALTGQEYKKRNQIESQFKDLKSNGWNWARSYQRRPEKMARVLAIMVVAYAWILSLGSLAVEQGRALRLQKNKGGGWRRKWGLFKEGLVYFVEVASRFGVCPPLQFVPDKRLF